MGLPAHTAVLLRDGPTVRALATTPQSRRSTSSRPPAIRGTRVDGVGSGRPRPPLPNLCDGVYRGTTVPDRADSALSPTEFVALTWNR